MKLVRGDIVRLQPRVRGIESSFDKPYDVARIDGPHRGAWDYWMNILCGGERLPVCVSDIKFKLRGSK